MLLLFIAPALGNPFQHIVYAQNISIESALNKTTTELETANIVNASKPNTDGGGTPIPGQYIVLLKENATITSQELDKVFNDLTEKIQNQGAKVTKEYKDVGIMVMKAPIERSSNMTTIQLRSLIDELKSDPHVLSVVQDVTVVASSQTLPTGVDRVDGDLSYTKSGDGHGDIDADIAILDTGVNKHPDLNVYRQEWFLLPKFVISGSPITPDPTDHNGHGTHVAGIAAAKDNSIGVVGVAPGARIWSVKVLYDDARGELSDLIAGIRYVTNHADQIDVANLSLGFAVRNETQSSAAELQNAIDESVNAGVIYVVAAMNGNIPQDASSYLPAAFPEVISVSAITDSDGKCGGLGPTIYIPHQRSIIRGPVHIPFSILVKNRDDSFASYSNYGSKIDIAAPGTNINSTYLKDSYKTESGTSMASPHVAGAAALYKATHPKASPSQVLNALLSSGSTPLTICDGKGHGYFKGDRDGIPEPLLYVKNIDKYRNLDLTIYVPLPVPTKIKVTEIPHRGPISPPPPPPPANTTLVTVSKPSNGTLSVNQGSGALAYIPNPDFHGNDSFTFKINGTDVATVSITLNKPSSSLSVATPRQK